MVKTHKEGRFRFYYLVLFQKMKEIFNEILNIKGIGSQIGILY